MKDDRTTAVKRKLARVCKRNEREKGEKRNCCAREREEGENEQRMVGRGGRVRIRLENDGKRAGRGGKPPNKPNELTRVVYQILFNL